jgi:hypothetical protein
VLGVVVVWRDLVTLVPVTRPRNDFVLLHMQPDRVGLHTRPHVGPPCITMPLTCAHSSGSPTALYLPFSVCTTDRDQRDTCSQSRPEAFENNPLSVWPSAT